MAVRGRTDRRRSPRSTRAPPRSAPTSAAAIAARRLGIPWVADFRDPWVENPVDPAMGRVDAWRRRTLEAWIVRTRGSRDLRDAERCATTMRAATQGEPSGSSSSRTATTGPSCRPCPNEMRGVTMSDGWSTQGRSIDRPSWRPSSMGSPSWSIGTPTRRTDSGSSSSDPRRMPARRWPRRASHVRTSRSSSPSRPSSLAPRRCAGSPRPMRRSPCSVLGPAWSSSSARSCTTRSVSTCRSSRCSRLVTPARSWPVSTGGSCATRRRPTVADALERFLATAEPGRRADPDGRYDRADARADVSVGSCDDEAARRAADRDAEHDHGSARPAPIG